MDKFQRHQQRLWSNDYVKTVYLSELNDDELEQRYKNLIKNLWEGDDKGRARIVRNMERRQLISSLIWHVLLERDRRTKTKTKILNFNEATIIAEATKEYAQVRPNPPLKGNRQGFSRVGQRAHILDMFEKGCIRIAPASSYDDPSLNPAQRDNELEQWIARKGVSLMTKIIGYDEDGNEVEIGHTSGWVRTSAGPQPNFYVLCCSERADFRNVWDFGAESLIIVKNKQEFIRRLLKAVHDQKPNTTADHGPCVYYDFYQDDADAWVPTFGKHIQYVHQNEYRFAWFAPEGTAFNPFFVELGSLKDIAEFYDCA